MQLNVFTFFSCFFLCWGEGLGGVEFNLAELGWMGDIHNFLNVLTPLKNQSKNQGTIKIPLNFRGHKKIKEIRDKEPST